MWGIIMHTTDTLIPGRMYSGIVVGGTTKTAYIKIAGSPNVVVPASTNNRGYIQGGREVFVVWVPSEGGGVVV